MQRSILIVVVAALILVGFGIYKYLDNQNTESRARLEREQTKAKLEQAILKARLERERKEKEAAERQEENASLAKAYAKIAGRKVMNGVGGGQDFRVSLKRWEYDNYNDEFTIKMEIYFNGDLIRDNHYNVDGVLTCSRNGENAKFARTYSNQKFKELEERLMWVGGIAAGVLVLGALNQ